MYVKEVPQISTLPDDKTQVLSLIVMIFLFAFHVFVAYVSHANKKIQQKCIYHRHIKFSTNAGKLVKHCIHHIYDMVSPVCLHPSESHLSQ